MKIYIYIYIYIYILIYILGVFPVVGMRKKNCRGDWLGYCQFFSKCESQYNKFYCDTGLDR